MFCKTKVGGYNWSMKPVVLALSLVAVLFSLNGCRLFDGSRIPGTQAPNVGPFDKDGNYVEAWADDPTKWRAYTPKDVDRELPQIAKNEQPPDHSVPLEAGKPHAKLQAAGPRSKTDTTHSVVKSTAKSKTHTAQEEEPPKPKSSVTKAKSSTATSKTTKASKTTRHTVKSGDSLSSIATRYGTTVSALKSANGISGSTIRDGKSLVIPARK